MEAIFTVICIFSSILIYPQHMAPNTEPSGRLNISFDIGAGASFTDKAFLLNFPVSLTLDYQVFETYFVQFAPRYTWLVKWNEHYLTMPIHIRKKINEKFSIFAGPALTYDIGYFKDVGISAGIYYHFSKRSSINISVLTFTLYDYNIDYLFIPIGLKYSFTIL